MKLTGARIASFLRKPDPAVRAVLLFGSDGGQVIERARALVLGVVDDLNDPFRVAELRGSDLAGDPARLADEVASMSLMGGRRVVYVREAGDAVGALFGGFFTDNPPGDAFIVVEAGGLGPRSSLRTAFEGAERAVAIGCYGDEGAALEDIIVETLKTHKLRADPEALAFLADHLGSDRLVTRGELEKLALYAAGKKEVSLADAVAVVGDSALLGLDDVIFGAADGDHAGADRALARLFLEGVSPVTVLRACARHLIRLQLIAGMAAAGTPAGQAVARLRPPVLFKQRDRLVSQSQRWTADRLAAALELVGEAELQCKTTGLPDQAICSRALMAVANAARARRRVA
jgi:DNA polymerase III subunit delta